MCDNNLDGIKCNRRGVVYLVAPDGKRVSGGPLCLECARGCVNEYAEKLNETWAYEVAQFPELSIVQRLKVWIATTDAIGETALHINVQTAREILELLEGGS